MQEAWPELCVVQVPVAELSTMPAAEGSSHGNCQPSVASAVQSLPNQLGGLVLNTSSIDKFPSLLLLPSWLASVLNNIIFLNPFFSFKPTRGLMAVAIVCFVLRFVICNRKPRCSVAKSSWTRLALPNIIYGQQEDQWFVKGLQQSQNRMKIKLVRACSSKWRKRVPEAGRPERQLLYLSRWEVIQ